MLRITQTNISHKKRIRTRYTVVFAWIILLLNSKTALTQTTYVPINHWAYNYLERLETKQLIQGVLNGTKPLSRNEVAGYLAMVHQRVAQGNELTRVEQDQLSFLNIEFKEELNELLEHLIPYKTRINRIRNHKSIRKIFPRILYKNDRNFLNWGEDRFKIYFDPILYFQKNYNDTDTLNHTEKVFQRSSGFRIRGNLGHRLGFFIDIRDTKESGTRKYRLGNYTLPGLGFVRATSPDHIYHDETVAYLRFGFKHIKFVFGKFSNNWGPGYTSSLILSDFVTSYDQFKLEIIFNKFKFTSLYAFLIDYQEHEDDILQPKKYFAAHRLEFALLKWLTLGFTETVMFKDRSFEPAYLNPIMFYRSAEHYLGSPDNMLMGLDFKCTVINHLKFYGELLIDDITTTKLGTGWYGNKIGYSAGIFVVDPLHIFNTDCRIEYARLRPYVYSHHNTLSYKHYNSLLGHPIGPNADELYVELNYHVSRYTKLGLFSKYWRHGANPSEKNIGGDADKPHSDGDDLYVKFLDGELETNQSVGISCSYELFRECYVKAKYGFSNSENVLVKKNQRVNSKAHRVWISLGLNY